MNNQVAIVYDWLDTWGGAERVLLTLSEMFPRAHWYSSVFDEKRASWAKKLEPQTSFLQKLPGFTRNSRKMSTPLYPIAFESFDFSAYDLVISLSSSFAKGIITRPPTHHICYMLTPSRFLWSSHQDYPTPKLAKPVIDHLKRWDKLAGQRPDEIISISRAVKERIKEIYGRDSTVIYPPFDTEYWEKITAVIPAKGGIQTKDLDPRSRSGMTNKMLNQVQHDKKGDPPYSILNTSYYLVVSRLEPYKNIKLIIKCFSLLKDENIIIVGAGTQQAKLKSRASKNVFFMQNISDEKLATLYQNAQALIMPQEEDFGLTSLEAQFFGCPVIAFRAGGAIETVVEEKTGMFFDKQTVESLQNALEKFGKQAYNLRQSTKRFGPDNVEKFEKKIFVNKITSLIT